jgi:DNA-binding CsgD family transcriptional regulator
MSTKDPLISAIGELVEFIGTEDPGLNELCQFAVIRTFHSLGATAMFGSYLDTDGSINLIGQYGYNAEMLKSWTKAHIDENIPAADALKTNNIIWLASGADWERDYPELSQYSLESGTKTFITWPITVRGAYMSVLGINLNDVVAPLPNLISFLETIGGLFALQLSRSQNLQELNVNDEISARISLFTRRQRDVLKLVADGLTNSQIGTELGFSESTIRQETMRIYEILGATGRADAVRMYRSLNQRKVS